MPGDMVLTEMSNEWEAAREVQQGFMRSRSLLIDWLDYSARCWRTIAWLETGGAPVGMFPDWPYEDGAVPLTRGDTILAYTDGVIEIENPHAGEWGVEGLQRTAVNTGTRCASAIVQAVFLAIDKFSRCDQSDDATVMVLRVQ